MTARITLPLLLLILGACATTPQKTPLPESPSARVPAPPESSVVPHPTETLDTPPERAPEEPAPATEPQLPIVAPWQLPERPPAPPHPSRLQELRIARYRDTFPAVGGAVRTAGFEPYGAAATVDLLALPRDPGGTDGYVWVVRIDGERRRGPGQFYGRVVLRVELLDHSGGGSVAEEEWTGNWIFSRVSYDDALYNSLYRLLSDENDLIRDAGNRLTATAFSSGFRYRVRLDSSIEATNRSTVEAGIRQVGYRLENDGDLYRVESYAVPTEFIQELRNTFAGGPYQIRVGPVDREVTFSYNQQ